jgi:thioesterase domain-containing protein
LAKSVGIHLRNLQQLRLPEQIQYIKDRLVFRVAYANRANSEKEFLLDNWAEPLPPEYLEVLAANFQAGQDYRASIYPGKVTLFRSYIQPIAQALHPDLGWSELIGGGLNIYDMPGNHNNLLKEPYIQLLGQKLKICLNQSNN